MTNTTGTLHDPQRLQQSYSLKRKPTSGVFRPEIEGLRSVAFLLVAVFHIWFNRVSGGVDVFFTVAGFLITVTLVGQVQRTGRVDAGRFFGRLSTRLLPQAVVALFAVLVLTLLIRPFSGWRDVFTQVFASAAYFENWLLAFNSVDYLAVDTTKSPVQHFWAMSIQGQFYVIWFAIFALLCLATRARKQSLKVAALWSVSALIVLSFAWSVLQTRADQQFAYFSTLTRVWEFGLGSLLALVIDRLKIQKHLAAGLSWLALLLIVSIGFFLPVADSFPGFVALAPVLAACIIIATGRDQAWWGTTRFLASRPMVWLGRLGYGVYLWHWPLLVFALEFRGIQKAGLETGLVVILGAVGLAWISKKLVEDPVLAWRGGTRRVQRLGISVASGAAVLVAGLAAGGVAHVDHRSAQERLQIAALESDPCFGASALQEDSDCDDALADFPMVPADPSRDYADIFDDRCATGLSETDLKPCVWGNADSETRIALVGNSHAAAWFPAYRAIAEKYGWRLDTYFKHGCTFNNATRVLTKDTWQQSCDEWVTSLNEHLAKSEPYSYLLTSASAQSRAFIDRESGVRSEEAGIKGYQAAWKPLIDRGTTLLAIKDYPYAGNDAVACSRADPHAECSVDATAGLVPPGKETLVTAAEQLDGAFAIDMTRWFCVENECPTVIGNVQVYRDASHFTETYGRSLAEPLLSTLREETDFADEP